MDDGNTEHSVTLAEIYAYLRHNQQKTFAPDDVINCPVSKCVSEKYGRLFMSTAYSTFDTGTVTIEHTPDVIQFILRYDTFSLNRIGLQILHSEGQRLDG